MTLFHRAAVFVQRRGLKGLAMKTVALAVLSFGALIALDAHGQTAETMLGNAGDEVIRADSGRAH
jgi:hypothetical protein